MENKTVNSLKYSLCFKPFGWFSHLKGKSDGNQTNLGVVFVVKKARSYNYEIDTLLAYTRA